MGPSIAVIRCGIVAFIDEFITGANIDGKIWIDTIKIYFLGKKINRMSGASEVL